MTHNFKLSHFFFGCRRAAAEVSQRLHGIGWQRCCQMLPLHSAAAKFRQLLRKLTRPFR